MKNICISIIYIIFIQPIWAEDNITLILDWFVNPNHGPIIVAQEKGFFIDQGLHVEIIAPSNPSDPPKMIAAGKADLAISYQPQLHLQVAEGLPLIRVGTLIATPLNCLLVLKEELIHNIANLKGSKIGFSVSGIEEALLTTILQIHGLTLKDIELINVNWSLSSSLMSGQVDAVIGAFRNFALNQMIIENVSGHCFFIEETGVPTYDELIYIAHAKNMDGKKIQRFLHAVEKATQYIVNYPEESWSLFSSIAPEVNNRLNKMAWYDTLPRFALRPGALDSQRYNHFEEFLFKTGLINSVKPISDLAIDLSTVHIIDYVSSSSY